MIEYLFALERILDIPCHHQKFLFGEVCDFEQHKPIQTVVE